MDGNSDGSSESAAGKDADQLGIPIEPDACALRIGRHPLYRLIRAAENALFRAKDRGGRQIVEAS
jgi:hypothetical protein